VMTGRNTDNPTMGVASYPVKVEGDDVLVEI
jgi:nitrite reductase/ring-hydroxylating ferredoxin subunit